MNIQAVLPLDRSAVSSISAMNNEPAWMGQLRLEAHESAGKLELPILEKTRIDRWNLNTYGQYKQSKPITELSDLPEYARVMLQEDRHGDNLVIQHNSGVVYHHLSNELAAQGVIFTDLETAVREHSDLVQPYFMTALDKNEHRLSALHTAIWNGGVFLFIPKNVRVETPLQALFISDDPSATFAPHILIIAETNSFVAYADNYISGAEAGTSVHNGAVEVFVKSGAHVQFSSVHHLSDQITDVSYRRAILEKDAKMDWIIGEMNEGNSISDTASVLKGNGSSSDAKAICVGTGDQKLSITTKAVHFGRNTYSRMITRAVVKDQSTAIINGITKIEKGATKSNGEQTEKVLMLSPKARGDANPILLIDEDDVKAGHAASVGQVNPEQIYYLMSRGISKKEAERLIIYGFLAPVVAQIPIKTLGSQLQTMVERKLGR